MARTTKTKKTVTRKRTVKKNVNTDPDFFKFDDDYENNEIAEKYEANWNNNDEEKEEVKKTTTRTIYKVEDNGNDIFIDSEEKDHTKLFNKLNKIARIILKVVIVISILIIIDLFLITRFEFGPLFAIRTKTYKDGGTKEYYGLGYKVIRYNVTNGREGIVVGNYSLKYNPIAKKVDLNKIKLTEENNGDYVEITGTVKNINEKNKRIVLQIGKNEIHCDMKDEFKKYNKISINKSVNIIGRIYVEDSNKLYIENGVVK